MEVRRKEREEEITNPSKDIFAGAEEVKIDKDNNVVSIIFNDLEDAKICRGKLRDSKGIVDKVNPNQPRKIHLSGDDDNSFIIKLSLSEYNAIVGHRQGTSQVGCSSNISFYHIDYGNLKLGKEIGRGGFGIVYEGEYAFAKVAIKKLHSHLLSKEHLEGFENEALVMTRLHHPNAVQLYGVCLQNPDYALVMEYMPKGSLYDLLSSPKNIPWEQRSQIGLDVGMGVAYLHQDDIVHCDLKSMNVLLDNDYRAKVTDFGLSRFKSGSSTYGTWTAGTWGWMAPELMGDNPRNTKEADVYAYGVVLWELGARKKPFDGLFPFGIAKRVSEGNREPISEDTPPEMAKLILKSWKQKPHKRPTMPTAIAILNKKYGDALKLKQKIFLKSLCKGVEEKIRTSFSSEEEKQKVLLLLFKENKKIIEILLIDDVLRKSGFHYWSDRKILNETLFNKIETALSDYIYKIIVENFYNKKLLNVNATVKELLQKIDEAKHIPGEDKNLISEINKNKPNLEKITMIWGSGASTNHYGPSDTWKRTALHWAAKHGHCEIINHLINLGADLEAIDRYGHTPLMVSVRELEHHKNINAIRTLLEAAKSHFNKDKYQNYIDAYLPEDKDGNYFRGMNPFQIAFYESAREEHRETAKIFVEFGANIFKLTNGNAKGGFGNKSIDGIEKKPVLIRTNVPRGFSLEIKKIFEEQNKQNENYRSLSFPERAKKWLDFGYQTEGKAPVYKVTETTLKIKLIGEDLGEERTEILEEFAGYLMEAIGKEKINKLAVKGHELYLDLHTEKDVNEITELLQQEKFTIIPLASEGPILEQDMTEIIRRSLQAAYVRSKNGTAEDEFAFGGYDDLEIINLITNFCIFSQRKSPHGLNAKQQHVITKEKEKEKEKETKLTKSSHSSRSTFFHSQISSPSTEIFAKAELKADKNKNVVYVIFNNLEDAKICRGALRDLKGIVDNNNPKQPRKIHMSEDDSFIIKLSSREYDDIVGQGEFNKLVDRQISKQMENN